MEEKACVCKSNEHNSLLSVEVQEAIHKIIKKEGYITHKSITKAISTGGGNYFGSLYEVDITGITEDGKKETNLFIKGIVTGDHLTIMSVSGMFDAELFFYNELAVVFDELQNEANVPANQRYNVAMTFQESIHEALILDNLSKKGYKTEFRMDAVSLRFAELCMEQLGRLHGLSFALEIKRPQYFDQKIRSRNAPFFYNEDLKSFITKSTKVILEYLDADIRGRFTASVNKAWHDVQRFYFDQKYKRTIIHSDYKANNVMVKEIDGEVISAVPVDYQFIHFGCPVIDFIYFISLSTDQEFRRNHLEHLKDHYFDSVTKMLKHFDIDIKSVFPREDFDDLYSEMLSFGLLTFVQIMPFLFTVDDEIPELDKDQLTDVTIKCDDRMKERARGLVDDFIRWGVL